MKLFLSLALTVASLAASSVGPARADANPGNCVVTVTLEFDSSVTTSTTGSIGVDLGGGGILCTPVPSTNIPAGLLTGMTINSGSGDGSVAGCGAILADGSYNMSFGTLYQMSTGDWAYKGSVAGGELTFVDLSLPALVGVASVVLDPTYGANPGQIQACAIGAGMTKLRFTGSLSFVD